MPTQVPTEAETQQTQNKELSLNQTVDYKALQDGWVKVRGIMDSGASEGPRVRGPSQGRTTSLPATTSFQTSASNSSTPSRWMVVHAS